MTIVITKHGYDRLKERTGFNPSNAQAIAERAYYTGRDLDDFPKEIKRYLKNVLEASSGDTLKVLGNEIYLFGGGCLITVLTLPPKIIRNNKTSKRRIKCYYDEEI